MFLIVDEFGAYIGKKSERLQVRKGNKVLHEVPLFKVDLVLITGRGISLSSDVVYLCAQNSIPIHFVSTTGKPYARVISPQLTGTVQTRREQLLAYNDGRGVTLAKAFAAGKLANQSNLLKYMAKYRKQSAPELFNDVRFLATEIEVLRHELTCLQAETVDEIRAQVLNLEGRGAQFYWDGIKKLLLVDEQWGGREHRGATDPINSALNYGYGILYSQIEGAILLAGLDPYAGFIHVDRPGKASLTLDLIEEFRQPVVDRTVFGLLNKGVNIELDDQGFLVDTTRRTLAEKVLDRLANGRERYERGKHTLRTIMHRQAQHLATFVRRERRRYEPFVAGW
jgi:CRISPR-associated protein Cas1